MGGNATQGKGSLYATCQHLLTDVLDNRQGCAAGTGLNGEAIHKEAGINHHLSGGLGQQDVARVLGVADCAGRYFGAVPHRVHNHHRFNVGGADAGREVRIRDEVVRQHHNVGGVTGVGQGVTK